MEPDERARTSTSGHSGNSGDPLVGRLLDGRYEIGERIARGGMASVYRATDLRLDRTVAVKVMHPGLGDEESFARRFVREARAAARLNHPNVVGVYDQGEEDGTVYLAMEYVPGRTLRDVVREEAPLMPVRALDLFVPVVGALAAAHRAGLVHRDVKPENVLLGDDDHGGHRIKVADFGLAKAVSAESTNTATGGVLIGTVSYLAPELVVNGEADARVDVYAAGVLLFELLTGVKPHEGESPIQVAYKHVHEDVPAPSSLVPGIPDYVDALVARATSRETTQRPADASVLLRHVDRVVQALRTGTVSDPELAADLRPLPGSAPDTDGESFFGDPDEVAEPGPTAVVPVVGGDGGAEATSVAPFDPVEMANAARTAPSRAAVPAPRPEGGARRAPSKAAAAPQQTRSRTWRGPLALVLAILLVAGVGIGAWWFGWARYTTTPAVLGMKEKAAVERVEAAGLGAEVGDPAYSETVPVGQVVSTDPAPTERVLKDGTVVIHLSQGPERYDVPKLRGMTEDEAKDELEGTRLAYGSSSQAYHESIPEGHVIRSSPAAGTTLKPDAEVDLVVSKGREPVEVKDWTGKSFEKAEEALSKAGLEAKVSSEEFSDDVKEGDVISQTPTSGTLYRGDTVTFVVSKGPELVEVPDVRASGESSARKELQEAGFEVRIVRDSGYLGLGLVFRTDPKGGTELARGSTVTVYLI